MKSNENRKSVIEISAYLRDAMPPGISETSVRSHIRRADLKKDSKGKYSLTEFLEIYQRAKASDNQYANRDPAKRRKTELECEILQEKLNQIRGEAITKSEHERILVESHSLVKKRLLNLHNEVAQRTSDVEAVKAVQSLVVDLFHHLEKDFSE